MNTKSCIRSGIKITNVGRKQTGDGFKGRHKFFVILKS